MTSAPTPAPSPKPDRTAGERPPPERPPRGPRAVLDALGVLGPPLTVAAVPLLYFGWVYRHAYLASFGLDPSLLRLTTRDYLIGVPISTALPVGAGLLFAVACAAGHRRLVDALAEERVCRWVTRVGAVLTLAWAGVPLAALLLGVALGLDRELLFSWASFVGILLTLYGMHLRHRVATAAAGTGRAGVLRAWGGPLTATLVGALALLTLLWGLTRWAQLVGVYDAARIVEPDHLRRLPEVVVYSREELPMVDPTDPANPCVGPVRPTPGPEPYRFRYEGLRLLLRSGDLYFLLPECWHRGRDRVVVLPDDPALRLEFAPGG